MTVAAPPRKRTRAKAPPKVLTLGWEILQWTHDYLRNPLDESQPFVFTDPQAQRVLQMYAIDARGNRLYRRCHLEEAKGWGKSPFAAAIALAEFAGPVCFGGWDADNRPVGIPYGSVGLPAPWVQVAAVSEDQTANTYQALYAFLKASGGRVAEELMIDEGRTRLYRTDLPAAFLERVTASAGSREGQPVTFAVCDEPQLWTPSNGGIKLTRTILRNVAKTNGWACFTGNAPVIGEGSVSEEYRDPADGALHLSSRPDADPAEDMTDDELKKLLKQVYGGSYWIDLDRLVSEIRDPAMPWRESKRFFLNLPDKKNTGEQWVIPEAWDGCASDAEFDPSEPTFACIRVARDHQSAAVVIAQRSGSGAVIRSEIFQTNNPIDDESMDIAPVEAYFRELHRLWRARVMAPKRYGSSSRERQVPTPGPEISYHGAFFERSAQALKAQGLVLVDLPSSQEKIAPAAEVLKELVLSRELKHDGDAELAGQVFSVNAKPSPKGWTLAPSETHSRIEAAVASMLAVHRAMVAKRPPSRRVRGLGGQR